jgi:hypothetical protein
MIMLLPLPAHLLEHVPAKCIRFAAKNMLQQLNLARFLIAEAIPLRRKAR